MINFLEGFTLIRFIEPKAKEFKKKVMILDNYIYGEPLVGLSMESDRRYWAISLTLDNRNRGAYGLEWPDGHVTRSGLDYCWPSVEDWAYSELADSINIAQVCGLKLKRLPKVRLTG